MKPGLLRQDEGEGSCTTRARSVESGHSYYVYLTRAAARYAAKVWAIQLAERLPTVPVPLLSPDPDVPLNVQGALDACFALVGYERLLDYAAPPPLPELAPAERDWLTTTLRAPER